jgi:hypothetical protein
MSRPYSLAGGIVVADNVSFHKVIRDRDGAALPL